MGTATGAAFPRQRTIRSCALLLAAQCLVVALFSGASEKCFENHSASRILRAMNFASGTSAPRLLLGIEGGATRTVALLAEENGRAIKRLETGPCNLKFLADAQLARQFRLLAAEFPRPSTVGIGLAGAWGEADRKRIRMAAGKVWPRVPCYATNDLETALTAAGGEVGEAPVTQVLIVSGTGSACYGKGAGGQEVKVGGWGHVLGDQGSGYEIGVHALQAVICHYDQNGVWPRLGQRILGALQLNEPNDLIGWAQAATKTDLASLAVEVFAAWASNDKIAVRILDNAARSLAEAADACARRLVGRGAGNRLNRSDKLNRLNEAGRRTLRFVLAGSILLRQPRFAGKVRRELLKLWLGVRVIPLKRESVWGAIELAKEMLNDTEVQGSKSKVQSSRFTFQGSTAHSPPTGGVVRSARLSPTEARHPGSMNLDKLPPAQAIKLMLSDAAKIAQRLLPERRGIERTLRAIVRAFRRGGRLFYVGAGTSGRLGVLDASERAPTFSSPPDLVQGVIAGGQRALWQSVEGAEDDAPAGARAMEFRGVRARDVVVGIAASGTTPFVWGALGEAKRRGATTALLCFHSFLKIPRALRPAIFLAPNLGPEVLTGSTRLKAGTATKLLLNIFTTLAMVRIGKVKSNLMIDLNPANVKLRDRAVRMVRALTQADYDSARTALERSDWIVKRAVGRLTRR